MWLELLSVALDLAEGTLGRPKQARAGEEENEMNCTTMVRTHPPLQAASTVYFTLVDDEEMLAAGMRAAGPQERVQRRTVEQIGAGGRSASSRVS